MNSVSMALCAGFLGLGVIIGYGLAPELSQGNAPDFATALGEENLLLRSGMFSASLEGMNSDNVDEFVVKLQNGRVGVTDQELRVFMLAWARFDAPGAFAWAKEQNSDWSSRLSQAATYAWGFADPQAALVALADSPEGGTKRAPMSGHLMAGWRASGDVPGITTYLMAMPNSRERETMTSTLLAEIGKKGPDAVIAWTDAIPEDAEGGFKRIAFNRASGVVARADPELAARWYEANRDKEFTEKSLPVIARRSIDHHDPAALFVWLAELPPLPGEEFDSERFHAIAQAMKWWLRRDPEAAQAWVNSFSEIPAVYDPALASLSQFYLKKNPDIAVRWAISIQDETLRSEALVKGVSRWRRRDSQAAEEWLAVAEISESDRARIVAKSPSSGGGRPRAGRPRP
jgi:hypothetical protein